MADDSRRRPDSEVKQARERQRSRTGCRTCRSRKVKCDETPGGCRNCDRLNLPCPNGPGARSSHNVSLDVSPGNGDRTQAGLRRSRTYRSCQACRNSKTRCTGEQPTCGRCLQRNLECQYEGKTAPTWRAAVPKSQSPTFPTTKNDGEYQPEPPIRPPSSANHGPTSAPDDPMPDVDASPNTKPAWNRLSPSLKWLTSPHLPDKDGTLMLVEEYFANVHNLRSFGFIHKPSYMQELDERTRENQDCNPLLLVLCALGAKFWALKSGLPLPEGFGYRAGNQWATRAQNLILTNLNDVCITNTMAIVLLHEHDIRVGNYASAFTLTGMAVRMAQALQVNLESSANIAGGPDELPWAHKESRRRLMWSVYVLDAWVGSGVDELTLVNERDIKIQLPCNERNFMLEIPCIVETLEKRGYLPFLVPENRPQVPTDNLDLQAQFIRLLSSRRKVLRFVKHLDANTMPWLPGSEWRKLEDSIISWSDELPASLRYSRGAVYSRKEGSQLGALLLLHITYHQTLVDLTRVGMPDLFKIRSSFYIPAEQHEFKERVQDRCYEHAAGIAMIFEEALKHGVEALADTWLSVVAHDSSRVIIHYLTRQLGSSRARRNVVRPYAMRALQANILSLRKMIPMYQLAKPLHAAASYMMREAGLDLAELSEGLSSGRASVVQDAETPATLEPPPQFSPEYILNPLAIYRMARRDIQDNEKNAPERRSSITTASPGSDQNPALPLPTAPQQQLQHQHQQQILPPASYPSASLLAAAIAPTPSHHPPPAQPQHQQQMNQQDFIIAAPASINMGGGHQQWGFISGDDTTATATATAPVDGSSGTGTGSLPPDFQLPTSLDNLQAYFPLMFNNFALPMDPAFGAGGSPAGGGPGDAGEAYSHSATQQSSYQQQQQQRWQG